MGTRRGAQCRDLAIRTDRLLGLPRIGSRPVRGTTSAHRLHEK